MLKRLRKLFGRGSAGASPPSPDPAPPVHQGPKIVHRPIAEADIDADAAKIVRRLTRFDHSAYLVGGCVRDLLLERAPKDFDIGTSATPRQVKRLFSNCRIIGRRFRLAHVYFQNGKILEVATFRAREAESDDDEESGRSDLLIRDDNIFGTPEEDALRRDFTINQLFYDVNAGNVLDHADGLDDLRRRMVRTIGDAEIRFREDPIRILRAIKFAARLDFEIEQDTLAALKKTRNLVPKAAAPRILEEINRFCRGGAARRSFQLLRETGVFEVILPDFAEGYHDDPRAWECLLNLLERIDRRQQAGQQVSTGEILAVLLTPLLARRMGWQEDGVVEQRREINVREMADEFLRPMAQRLRGPKRDQEHCRQILMTLYRMVPARQVRRSTEQSILRRPCTRECAWILEGLGARSEGELSHAAKYWGERVARRMAAAPATGPATARTGERRDEEARPSRSRRSRRSRGRRRSGDSPATDKPKTATPANKPDPSLPPPWDDGYFFAALPTVPQLEGESDGGDRYGATEVTGETPPERDDAAPVREDAAAADPATPESDDGTPPRRTRRRRRRRRRRPAQEQGSDDASSSSSDPV